MDRRHCCPFPEYARVFCRSIQRKVKDFFSFFTCSMSDMKVVDAKYTLYPDMDFIVEVKKSNSRTLKLGERGVGMDNDVKEALPLYPRRGHSESQVLRKEGTLSRRPGAKQGTLSRRL